MKRFIFYILLIFCFFDIHPMQSSCLSEFIKLNKSLITIEIDPSISNLFENPVVSVQTAPIFSVFGETHETILQQDSTSPNIFKGYITTEIEITKGCVLVETDEIRLFVGVDIQSGKEVCLNVVRNFPDSDKNVSNYKFVSTNDIELFDLGKAASIFSEFYQTEGDVPKWCYDSWEHVREFERDSLWNSQIRHCCIQDSIEPWILNSLKCRFASIQTLPYVKAAERIHGLQVEEPPIESYSFIDEIDYSQIIMNQIPPYNVLRSYLYALLRFPDGGFCDIGEMSLDAWRKNAESRLSIIIKRPHSLLLDLLSGMAFIKQIEIDKIPLTPRQIHNIESGFDNDLDLILKIANEKLLDMLTCDGNLYDDFTQTDFDPISYADKLFPGKSVVIDFWDTWCAPCVDAINKVKYSGIENKYSDVIFLYVSSTTSDDINLIQKISQIGGKHVRINNNISGMKLANEFGFTGIPSYIFLNKNHEIIYSGTGFPGMKEYKYLIQQINK